MYWLAHQGVSKLRVLCWLSCSVVSDSLRPSSLLCPWGFSRQEYWSGLPCPPPGDLPNPRREPRSPALQGDSLLSEPPRKSKNSGVGSLSLLKGNFPTQESNRGLLHCRPILYQLSHQGSPSRGYLIPNNDEVNYFLRPLHGGIISQFISAAQSCPTLCVPLDCSTPGLPVHCQLSEFTQTVSIESVMPSNHLTLCCPPFLLPSIFPSIRVTVSCNTIFF